MLSPSLRTVLLLLALAGAAAFWLARPKPSAIDAAEMARAESLIAAGRSTVAEPVLARLAASDQPEVRLFAYRRWAQILGPQRGDFLGFMDKERRALALDPDSADLHLGLYMGENVLGHDGAAVNQLEQSIRSAVRLGPLRLGAPWMTPPAMRALLDRSRGDFAAAAREDATALAGDPPGGASARADRLNLIGDQILNHQPAAAPPPAPRPGAPGVEMILSARDRAYADLVREDWRGAASVLATLEASPLPPPMKNTLPVLTRPWLAYALFHAAEAEAARATIARTPTDCALCQRIRGRMAAESGDTQGAERAFAAAIAASADLPFAYVDRGRARLARGDIAGALGDCVVAETRSPHFADAPELCGEARLQRGDAAGAARDFARAGRLAPHWSRNQLLWIKALKNAGGKG